MEPQVKKSALCKILELLHSVRATGIYCHERDNKTWTRIGTDLFVTIWRLQSQQITISKNILALALVSSRLRLFFPSAFYFECGSACVVTD
jgi:hypothetical protein